MKKYNIGFYGGKFMPFHLGHYYCLEQAASECNTVYAILFINGADEVEIYKNSNDEYLSLENRKKALYRACSKLRGSAHVIPVVIDVADCRLKNGDEDWDAETPLVRSVVGDKIDAVYSSEPSYGEYFNKAYPEAKHVLVDPPRIVYPISGTKIRNMTNEEEIESWRI